MLFGTLYLVFMLAFMETNVYMLRKDGFRRCRWLKFLKAGFYIVFFAVAATLQGISLKRFDDHADWEFRKEEQAWTQSVRAIFMGFLGFYVFLVLVSLVYALCQYKKIRVTDFVHLAIHIVTLIGFCAFTFIGVISSNFSMGSFTFFMKAYINIYSLFMMIMHAPSSENVVLKKQDPEEKSQGAMQMSIQVQNKDKQFHSVLDVNRNELRMDAMEASNQTIEEEDIDNFD